MSAQCTTPPTTSSSPAGPPVRPSIGFTGNGSTVPTVPQWMINRLRRTRAEPPYDRYSLSGRWQGLRAELWLCSPVWCALRMGHGPELVSDAAAEEGWSRRSSLRPRTLSRSPVATGSRTSRRGVQQSAPFCSAWHPVATPGMGASVDGRHERLAALLMPASPGNAWALPGKRRARDYGVLPYASW